MFYSYFNWFQFSMVAMTIWSGTRSILAFFYAVIIVKEFQIQLKTTAFDNHSTELTICTIAFVLSFREKSMGVDFRTIWWSSSQNPSSSCHYFICKYPHIKILNWPFIQRWVCQSDKKNLKRCFLTSDARFRFRNRNQFLNDSIFGWNRNQNQENWIVLESESCI